MLEGIKLPEEYELISVFCAFPTYDFDDPNIDSYHKEHIYEFCTLYERVKISFSPASNDFQLHTYDLETNEFILNLHIQDRVQSLEIVKNTKEKAIIQLNCGYSLGKEAGYQIHKVTIHIKPRVRVRQEYSISYV
jgi:hypothetical protein